MREELNHEDQSRKKMHQALDATLSGLSGDPWLFQRVSARAAEGEPIMKKRLSAGLILAIVLLLAGVVALAVTLLTHREVVEQVAVPLAVENDPGAGVNMMYSPDELAELVRSLNENGITLDENNPVMQAVQNGLGYYEEEAIMEICRQAFGGYFFTWTLEQQDWYDRLMVEIGFYETHQSRLPGEDNMTYEDAEAFAFRKIREAYGEDLPLEDRTIWSLERCFNSEYQGEPSGPYWEFTLEPRDLDHGRYSVSFSDADPEGTADVWGNVPDWSQPYSGEEVYSAFCSVYSWFQGRWPQEAWNRLHEMLQAAEIEPGSWSEQALKAYRLTSYPLPAEGDISREDAVRKARETMDNPRAALDGAVLAEYEGVRAWLVSFVINQPEDGAKDETAGLYVLSVDSVSGTVAGPRKQTPDDDSAFAYVPEAAYKKAREGLLLRSEAIRLATEAILEKYPDLDILNEEKYDLEADQFGNSDWFITCRAKDVHLPDASAEVSPDGTVGAVEAEPGLPDGDSLFRRYWNVYGYFGEWSQSVWVQLGQDITALDPKSIDGILLKSSRYPEESSVIIGRDKAKELGIQATGKRVAEVNTCVLVDADPHPVWIMRILTDNPDDPVIGIDAETGDVVFTETYKVDYTPHYVLYSMPSLWRKTELEMLGAPYMAKVAVTYRFCDMWLDEPELDVDNTDLWETQQEGLTVRFIGRWKGMKCYEVELDENGFVLRCEESDSPSTEEQPGIG